jgi:hypothetical protein
MVVDELIGAALIKPVEVANTQAAEGGCHWHSCATCGRQQHVSSSAVACSRAGLRRDLDHSSLLDAGALRIPFATREPLLDTCEITHRAATLFTAPAPPQELPSSGAKYAGTCVPKLLHKVALQPRPGAPHKLCPP